MTRDWFGKVYDEELAKVRGEIGADNYDKGRFPEAAKLFKELSLAPDFARLPDDAGLPAHQVSNTGLPLRHLPRKLRQVTKRQPYWFNPPQSSVAGGRVMQIRTEMTVSAGGAADRHNSLVRAHFGTDVVFPAPPARLGAFSRLSPVALRASEDADRSACGKAHASNDGDAGRCASDRCCNDNFGDLIRLAAILGCGGGGRRASADRRDRIGGSIGFGGCRPAPTRQRSTRATARQCRSRSRSRPLPLPARSRGRTRSSRPRSRPPPVRHSEVVQAGDENVRLVRRGNALVDEAHAAAPGIRSTSSCGLPTIRPREPAILP